MHGSIRNYAVLHIPPNEGIVFETKERAPFLICIELYRPEEISIATRSHSEAEASYAMHIEPAEPPKRSDGLLSEPSLAGQFEPIMTTDEMKRKSFAQNPSSSHGPSGETISKKIKSVLGNFKKNKKKNVASV